MSLVGICIHLLVGALLLTFAPHLKRYCKQRGNYFFLLYRYLKDRDDDACVLSHRRPLCSLFLFFHENSYVREQITVINTTVVDDCHTGATL